MVDTAKIVLAANEILNELKNKNGKLTYPINPFEL